MLSKLGFFAEILNIDAILNLLAILTDPMTIIAHTSAKLIIQASRVYKNKLEIVSSDHGISPRNFWSLHHAYMLT